MRTIYSKPQAIKAVEEILDTERYSEQLKMLLIRLTHMEITSEEYSDACLRLVDRAYEAYDERRTSIWNPENDQPWKKASGR